MLARSGSTSRSSCWWRSDAAASSCCATCANRESTLRTILLVHAYLLAALVAGVVLSYLINYGLQWMIGHEQGISSRFVSPDRIIDSPWAVIQKILQQYWTVYGGKRTIYGYRYVTFPVLLVLGMIALAARTRHRGGRRPRSSSSICSE